MQYRREQAAMSLATLQPQLAEDVRIPFSLSRFLSLGVEVEVQLVDWKTTELCPGAPRLLQALGQESGRFRPELFQSMLEFATGVCNDMGEVAADLLDSCRKLHFAAEANGIEIVGVATHSLDGAHRDTVSTRPIATACSSGIASQFRRACRFMACTSTWELAAATTPRR